MALKPRGEIPDIEISDKFISGLYSPSHLPKDLNLTNFIEEVEEPIGISKEETVYEPKILDSGQELPVSLEESREVQRQTELTLKRIDDTRKKILEIQNKIDSMLSSKSGDKDEFAVTMDISKKPRIKRAIKRVFGYKTDIITFSMYKEMLKAKASIEEEEAQGYLDGSWEE